MIKPFLKSKFAGDIASSFIRRYIQTVKATSKFTYINREHADALQASGKGFILAFWHSRLLMGPTIRSETDLPVYMLISSHRDGEIIANAVEPFGISFIRGSAANKKKRFKDKGGAPAITQMKKVLEKGAIVGFTPDGPRGPRQKVQPGIIRLSQMTGAPILPGAYATSRGWTLSTWDQFWLPAPFSKGVYCAGNPLFPEQFQGPEATQDFQLALENTLNETLENAKNYVDNKL